jgi:hypothetical protein
MRFACILASLCVAAGLSIRSQVQGGATRPAILLEAIPAILEAFRTHRIVSYPGGHTDGNEGQAQLRALIRDPPGRRITSPGTIALQAHDATSAVLYKNIRIRPLD